STASSISSRASLSPISSARSQIPLVSRSRRGLRMGLNNSGFRPSARARKLRRDRRTSGIWERALEMGDKLARELIDEAVEALGAGIASAVNLLDVEAVIIGGGIGVRLRQPY